MEKFLTVLGRLLLLGLLGGVAMNVDIQLKSVAWLARSHDVAGNCGAASGFDRE